MEGEMKRKNWGHRDWNKRERDQRLRKHGVQVKFVSATVATSMCSYPGREMSAEDRALVEAFDAAAKQQEQAA